MAKVQPDYNVIDPETHGTYVVITEDGYWGADSELPEALSNACLREERKIDFFNDIDDQASLARLHKEWQEWGKEEHGSRPDKVKVTIYHLHADVWAGWRVNPLGGSVTAIGLQRDGEDLFEDEVLGALLKEATISAWYEDGVLIPRSDLV